MAGRHDPRRRQRPASDGPRKSPEELADPARGEKVPRCRSCGLPDQPGNKLIPGMWGYVRFNMPLELCERCVMAFRPRPDVDPLTALEDVA